jgi:hypothetical protein
VSIENTASIASNVAPPAAPNPPVTNSAKRQKTGDNSRCSTQTKNVPSNPTKRKHTGHANSSTDSIFSINRKALVNDNFIKFAREKILIPPKMSDQEAADYKRMIDKFEDKIRVQCRHRFSYQHTSDEDFIESIGLGTRSADLVDNDAMEVSTSDRRRLSRYHMEDCLRLAVGQTVRLYFKKSAVHDPKGWWNRSYPLQGIIDLQRSESFKMMGEVYYELVATVSQANLNQEVHFIKFVTILAAFDLYRFEHTNFISMFCCMKRRQ